MNARRRFARAAALAGLMLVGGTTIVKAQDADAVHRGKEKYEHTCAPCHGRGPGDDGRAMLPGTAALQIKYGGSVPAVLEDRPGLTAEVLRPFLRQGSWSMPPFRPTELTDAQIEDIAAYLAESSSAADRAAAQGQDQQNQDSACAPSGGLEFICGPRNAEDLVAVPGTRWIIASGMAEGAALSLIDSREKTWSRLYPGDDPRAEPDLEVFGNCPGAPTNLVSHGLTLRPGENGQSTLYVVGHGGREAIEVFDVEASDGGTPVLTWKGCVLMPEPLEANSVAAFDDGTLLATVLVHPGKTFADQLAGESTGGVYAWSPGDDDFQLLRGTELPGNNGIEVSEDGREFFVVSSGLHTVTAYSRDDPARALRTSSALPFTPDNLHMSPDGRLLTAGMKDDVPACGGAPSPEHDLEQLSTCPRGFMAVAIDPETLEDTLLAEGPANPDFSNATMVLVMGDEFWLATFLGDRIAYGSVER